MHVGRPGRALRTCGPWHSFQIPFPSCQSPSREVRAPHHLCPESNLREPRIIRIRAWVPFLFCVRLYFSSTPVVAKSPSIVVVSRPHKSFTDNNNYQARKPDTGFPENRVERARLQCAELNSTNFWELNLANRAFASILRIQFP